MQQHADMLRRTRNGSPEDLSGGLMNWGSHLVKVGRLGACTTRRDILRFFEALNIDENSIRLALPSCGPGDMWSSCQSLTTAMPSNTHDWKLPPPLQGGYTAARGVRLLSGATMSSRIAAQFCSTTQHHSKPLMCR